MPTVLLGAYALAGVAHVVTAMRPWDVAARITKAALMPVLAVWYVVAADPVLLLVLAALALAWVGDIVLIREDDTRFFQVGMAAFLLSHACYIVAFVSLTHGVHVAAIVISVLVALAAEVLILRLVNPPKAMRGAIMVYGVALLTMSACALQYALVGSWPRAALPFAGSLLFVLSDTLLGHYTFGTRPRAFEAFVMVPYILAQGLIVYGLAG